ncbi:MAG: hypothetical protein OEL55_06720, partial [Desulfobulbaceae bacterium]|nr:hypothetical protein [Desulfobulbaceae bacterium]
NGGPVFYFGTVNDDGTITNTTVIGADTVGDENSTTDKPSIITGSGTSGQFFSLDSELTFGFSATGYVKLLEDLSINETWTVNSSGLSEGIIPEDITAPTGSVSWKGFVTGMSENIADPNSGRRLFMNNNSSGLTMNINRDSGTVNGSFTAADYSGSGTTINVNIGANGSAYVLDDNLIALLDGSVTYGTSNSSLPGTNYMVTENPDTPLANYVEWGIWEAAYIDPGTSNVYDVHFPGSFWVAGVPTTPGNFPTGSYNYSGKAVAAKITGTDTQRLEGTSNFNVNFADIDGGGTIGGSINLPDGFALSFTSQTLASGNFNITAVGGVTSGQVSGTFFGPNANATAGNFAANVSTDQYIGVFGANR